MNQTFWIFVAILSCCIGSALASQSPAPNVVVFFVDDLGYGDLGVQGNEAVKSPNIDSLARDGVHFTQWISGSSICTPSRGALLSGRLPIRIGLASSDFKSRVFSPTHPTGLLHSELTLAEALKERGYYTHMTGKWHLGIGAEGAHLPTNHGFDHYFGMPITNVQTCMPGKKIYTQGSIAEYLLVNTARVWLSMFAGAAGLRLLGIIGNRGFIFLLFCICGIFGASLFGASTYTLFNQKNCLLMRDLEIIQQPIVLYNLTQRLTADATAFIQRAVPDGRPWFLYMSYVKVHTALFNNEEFGENNYHNNIAELDWSIGKILKAIEEVGARENTLVWFTSDNGPFKERGPEGGSSGLLRGAKGQTFEGGIRVPGIVRYPARFPRGKTLDDPVSTMDIFPTTLRLVDDALGRKHRWMKPRKPLDGKDITEYIRGEIKESPHNAGMIHYCGEELSAVRVEGRYKAHFATAIWEGGLDNCPSASICGCAGDSVKLYDPPLLFDLKNDISESKPLTRANFSRFEEIQAKVQALVNDHKTTLEKFPPQKSQMRPWHDLSLLPCCSPPFCECDKAHDNFENE